MDARELEKLGLNRNESKVYLALLGKGQATASELVKFLGVHRNIIYDNLEKLIEKGLVSYLTEGTKRKFSAENPEAIIEFLNTKKENLEEEITVAKMMLPEIAAILSKNKERQEAALFRGIKGIKKILSEILNAKEFWVMGVSNESVSTLGETYWENFNKKISSFKIKENLLFNSNFENMVGVKNTAYRKHKILPSQLTQPTEIMMFDNKVVIIVYAESPLAILIDNSQLFNTFRKQFDFLWSLS
jgi:sugar-specific transcriptional regulator TrmB